MTAATLAMLPNKSKKVFVILLATILPLALIITLLVIPHNSKEIASVTISGGMCPENECGNNGIYHLYQTGQITFVKQNKPERVIGYISPAKVIQITNLKRELNVSGFTLNQGEICVRMSPVDGQDFTYGFPETKNSGYCLDTTETEKELAELLLSSVWSLLN
jgi:hypothetical protein